MSEKPRGRRLERKKVLGFMHVSHRLPNQLCDLSGSSDTINIVEEIPVTPVFENNQFYSCFAI
jgi:hypothetical protein